MGILPGEATVIHVKKCSRCGESKSLELFGSNKRNKDGLDTYCKPCKRIKTNEWRAKNTEKSKKLSRESKTRQRERDGEEVTRSKWNEWYAKNAERRAAYERARHDPTQARAQNELNKAVREGRVVRPTHCEKCGREKRVDGHHTDYSKPLVVIWLCRSCHRKEQG